MQFNDFFERTMIEFVENLCNYSSTYTNGPNELKIVCHSKKFAKAFLSYSLLNVVKTMKGSCVEYVYASEDMIDERFQKLSKRFFVEDSKKKHQSIDAALKRHFSVIFRELSKCFPSTVIFIGTNVGKMDYEIYAKHQHLEGSPVDVRRLKKLKQREGILEK